jgi:hypothetical protein
MFFQCFSAKNAKRNGNRIMSTPNFDQRCKICRSFIIYDSCKRELSGKCIPLDLNHKRHFCSGADKISHECLTVERVKKIVEYTNNTELSSFELELGIVDGAKK